MSHWFYWVLNVAKELVRKNKFLLVLELAMGFCVLIFLLILLRIFLF
jgi:hypothetical protein